MDMDIKKAENKVRKAESEARIYPEPVKIKKRKTVKGKGDNKANLKKAVVHVKYARVKYADESIQRKLKNEKKVKTSLISSKSKVPIKKATFFVNQSDSGSESIRKKRLKNVKKHQYISKGRSIFDNKTDSSTVSTSLAREEQFSSIGKQKTKIRGKELQQHSALTKRNSDEDTIKAQERKNEEVKKSAKDRNIYIKRAENNSSDSTTMSRSGIKKASRTVKKVNNKVNKVTRTVKFLDSEEKAAYMKEAVKGTVKQKIQQKIYTAIKKPVMFTLKIVAKLGAAAGKYVIGAAISILGVLIIPIMFLLLLFAVLSGGYEAMNASAGNVVSQVPLYLQYDVRWGDNSYGNEIIATSGCGPTSVAMVVSYFLQEEITPDQVVDWAGNTYYVNGVGTSFDMYPAAAEKYGLICNNIPASQVTEDLSEGRIVIASAGPGIFTTEGHLIVLRGVDADGNILVNDPNDSDTKNHFNTPFSPSTIFRECIGYYSFWKEGFEPLKIEYTQNDLYILAKIITCEAGSDWVTNQHQQLVASVVLNRVNSSSFPDTIEEVIYQEGQYAPITDGSWDSKEPDARALENALYVLENGSIAPSNVVYQANFPQGSGIYARFENPYTTNLNYRYTYFCY